MKSPKNYRIAGCAFLAKSQVTVEWSIVNSNFFETTVKVYFNLLDRIKDYLRGLKLKGNFKKK